MKNRSSSVSYGNGLVAINRIFYYRTSIPRKHRCQIGISEFKISLKTAYLQKAKAIARRVGARAQRVFDILDGGYWKSMNHELIKNLALKYLHDGLRDDVEFHAAKGYRNLEKAYQQADDISLLILDQQELLASHDHQGIISTAVEVLAQAEEDGLDVTELVQDKVSFHALCTELLEARIELLKVSRERELGIHSGYSQIVHKPLSTSAISDAKTATAQPDSSYPTLLAAMEVYEKENAVAARGKSKWSTGTATQHRGSMNLLVFVLGNLRLNQVDADAIKKYKDYMHFAPSNASKKPQYREKNYEQMMSTEIPEGDRMTDQTLKDHFVRINKFLNWANARYGLSIPNRDILQIRLHISPQAQREDYTQEELTRYFHAPAYTESQHSKAAYFWLPLLALFTGARLEELCQLSLDDFKQTDSGRWYIDINDDGDDKQLKNYGARRTVPLHDELIGLGLIDRVEHLRAKGFNKLFPELKKTPTRSKYGDDVSRWFTAFRLAVGIGTEKNNKKNFHSFRHTFINHFKQLGLEGTETWATLQEVVGHSRGRSMTSNRYAKGLNPEIAYERVIGILDYGIDLSHLKGSKYVYLTEALPIRTRRR